MGYTRTIIVIYFLIFLLPVGAWASDLDGEANDDSPTNLDRLDGETQRELSELSSRLRREASNFEGAARVYPLTVDEAIRQVSPRRTPESIFRWIRDNIEFAPYSGNLRGVEGTLADRSGNAIDQALLAAAMLEEANYDYRFVSGRLHTADARRILDTALGAAALFSGYDNSLRDFSDRHAPSRHAVVQTIENHFWLEVLVGDEYRIFDPIAAPLYGMTPATAADRHQALPADRQTTAQITLISRHDDGQTHNHITVEGPLRQFAYRSLVLGFEDDPARLRGHRPIVTIDGQSTRGVSIAVASLEELELRFRIRMGPREHQWIQPLYRRGQGVDIFDFDHQHFSISLIPGWVSADQMRTRAGQATSRALDAFDEWLEREGDRAETDPALDHRLMGNAVLDELATTLPFAYAHLLDRSMAEVADLLGVHPLLTRPRVVTVGVLRRGDEFVVDLDMHGDRIDALPLSGVPAIAGPAFLGMQGQIRDQLTGEFLENYGDGAISTVGEIFRQATRQSIRFTTVEGRTLEHLDLLSVEDAIAQTIRSQVRQRGLYALAPLRPIEEYGVERFGWWTLDPLSGALQAHSSDALFVVGQSHDDDSMTINDLMRGHLRLIARHFNAADHATQSATAVSELTCPAARQFLRLSRAFCATSQALPRADIDACLDDPPTPGGDLLNLSDVECADRLAPFRCASAYATAILENRLTLGPADATPPSLSSPMCP